MIKGAAFRVLECFVAADTRNFAELCEEVGYPTDLGGYYIRQLVGGDYLEKSERGQYKITVKGKQLLAASYGHKPYMSRTRLAIILVAQQEGKFLILQRTKQPFIGSHQWPAASVHYGEQLSQAAMRTAELRFGVSGTVPEFKGFFRRIDMYDNAVFDDKLFAVHTLHMPADAVITREAGTGHLISCPRQDMENLPRISLSLLPILEFSESLNSSYEEFIYPLTAADL